jgi:hypothetical protein
LDHDDVLEQIELAAVETGGLDRLMAGDTVMAAAVVGHVTGCDACSEELRRLSRAAPLLRDFVRTTPPGDLRERTLAYVEAHGRPRGSEPTAVTDVAATEMDAPAAIPVFEPRASTSARRRRDRRGLAFAAAAALAILVGSLSFLAGRSDLDRQTAAVAALQAVNRATIEISGQPDARRVALASNGSATTGTLLFSPSTTRLVVVANDLQRPPAGKEYRCWVEVDGQRENVGRMFFAGDLAFWVGETPPVSAVPEGTTFGVSLTDVGSSSLDADPVVSGTL